MHVLDTPEAPSRPGETLQDRECPVPAYHTRVAEVNSRCRLLIVPLFRGSSRFESLILSHHSRFTCECNKEEIDDDDELPRGWQVNCPPFARL